MPADGPVTLLTDSSADLDRAREQAVCDEVVLACDLGVRRRLACAAARRRAGGLRLTRGGPPWMPSALGAAASG